MILLYKVTFHRLDNDNSLVFEYESIKEARRKYDELLYSVQSSDVPFKNYVLRLGEVRIGSNGFYDDKLLEID